MDGYQVTGYVFANLLFQNHYSALANISAGVASIANSDIRFDNCTFSNNTSEAFSGALRIQFSSAAFSRCTFLANTGTVTADTADGGGGAMVANDCPSLTFEDCVFRLNQLVCPATTNTAATRHGGALQMVRVASSRMVNCLFQDNQITITGANDKANSDNRAGGAISIEQSGKHTLVNCVIFRNWAPKVGGGLYIRNPNLPSAGPSVRLVNCSIVRNLATAYGTTYSSGGGVFVDYPLYNKTELLNCIVWSNSVTDPLYRTTELEQVGTFDNAPRVTGNNCCIQNLGVGTSTGGTVAVSGLGNISQNPMFLSETGGDLRLSSGSPCIDGGNSLVDTDLTQIGTQPLPDVDIAGNLRIVDGDGNGRPEVDMGANEFQGG
jgi:hypothetical protein